MSTTPDNVEIEKLEDLVYEQISKGKRITGKKITDITTPGEQYGSKVLRIDLTLEDDQESTELLSMFAKMIPDSEYFQDVFSVQHTFKIETAFYEVIVPTLQNFQRIKGINEVIDFFPRFYGARTNLEGGDRVDHNGIILLENLKTSGFVNLDRFKGCDMETTKFILKDIAQFHAVPIALKIQRHDLFENKVKKYMACFYPLTEYYSPEAERKILDILGDREACIASIPKFKKWFKHSFRIEKKFREPFATLVHKDMWVNNFMVKFDGERVVKNKFVDFQGYSYDSPVKDLLFFLFTSVQFETLKNNVDELLKYYHEHFVETLEDLGCDSSKFSYDKFMEEIQLYGGFEIGHIIFMYLFIVSTQKELSVVDSDPGLIPNDKLSSAAKERACWTLLEFEKRKWMELNEWCT